MVKEWRVPWDFPSPQQVVPCSTTSSAKRVKETQMQKQPNHKVTPTSFLELLNSFVGILADKRKQATSCHVVYRSESSAHPLDINRSSRVGSYDK